MPKKSTTMVRPSWIAYPLAGGALVASTFLIDSPVYGAVVYVGAGLSAAVALLARAGRAPGGATAWRLLGVGIALFMVGDATWSAFELVLHRTAPFPSPADGAYLLGYVGLAAGVALIGLCSSSNEAKRAFVDGLIVALGVSTLIWEYLMEPYWLDRSLPLLSRAISAAYPLMDLLLLCTFLGLLFSGLRRSISFGLLVVAGALNLAGDVVYSMQVLGGSYSGGTWLDATWMVAYLCLGTAALHPSMPTVGERSRRGGDQRARLWLLGSAACVAPAAVLTGVVGKHAADLPIVHAATLAIILLTVLRMSGLMRELRQRIDELRRQEHITREAVEEQRRSADELRRNEARFRSLVVNMSDVICLIDTDGVIGYVSPAVERVLGYSDDELVGRNGFELVHPDDVPRAHSVLDQVSRGETVSMEIRVRRKDGSVRWVEAVLDNRLEQPDLNAIVIVYRDVTEAKALEQQLLQSQKLEAVGQLAGGVAHDFNNILSVISNYAEFVIEDLPPGDPKREDVEEIQKASQRASNLVRQLLTFSRREIIRRRVLDLNSIIFDMQKLLRSAIPENIDMSVRLTAAPVYVDADPTQVEQILMNLCVNARDAMLDGGCLEIATRIQEVGSELARRKPGLSPGLHVVLSISDTGIGMPTDVQDRAFEPFFTTKDRGQGTGLGLATVYGIVDRLGGYIEVQSAPGKGTTMDVYLPSSDQVEDVREERLPAPSSGGSETILVAEDEEAVRNLVERMLAREGYRVLAAPSAERALEICDSEGEQIDMLLSDVIMPETSGKELAERIAQRRPGLPVVFMSGYTDEIIARHGILEEGEVLIQKPFDAKELLARVRQTLDAAASRDAETQRPVGAGIDASP